MTPEKPPHDGEWVRVPRAYLEHVLGTLEYLRASEPYGDVNVDYDLSLALGQTKTHLAASPAPATGTQEGERAARVDARIASISAAYERFIPDYHLNSARDAVRRTLLDAPK